MTEDPPHPRTPPSPRGGAATAAELRSVREELGRLEFDIRIHAELSRDTAGLLAETIPRLNNVDERLAHSEELLAQLLTEPAAPRNAPVHWPTLTVAEAEQRWIELAEWVATILVDWYQLNRSELPDCWPRHRPAVVELSWLRTSYIESYFAKSPPHLAAEWHARWRRDALANIATAIPKEWCRPGAHLIHELDGATTTQAPWPQVASPWETTGPPQPGSTGNGFQHPGHDRAEPRWWRPHLQQAITEDLEWRRRQEGASTEPP